MTTSEIKILQSRIGANPDGFWGRLSIEACQLHLRKLMPAVSPWPKPNLAALSKFYGEVGNENNLVPIQFPYPMFYEGKTVLRTRVHAKCADSLLRVLKEIGDRWRGEEGIMEEAADYGGCFNFRPMRGGSSWSLHAWGAAIDLDPDDNGNKISWPVAADMPIEIMEAFSREGWVSAGAFWGRDAMHFQATSL